MRGKKGGMEKIRGHLYNWDGEGKAIGDWIKGEREYWGGTDQRR